MRSASGTQRGLLYFWRCLLTRKNACVMRSSTLVGWRTITPSTQKLSSPSATFSDARPTMRKPSSATYEPATS